MHPADVLLGHYKEPSYTLDSYGAFHDDNSDPSSSSLAMALNSEPPPTPERDTDEQRVPPVGPAKESVSASDSTPSEPHTAGLYSIESADSLCQEETNRITEDLDPVFDANEYFGQLEKLALDTATRCGISTILSGNDEDCLKILRGCRDALQNLKAAEYCSSFYNLFVEDEQHQVANCIIIYETELDSLLYSLERMGQVPEADTGIERSLTSLSTKLQLKQGNIIKSISKALALGLISFNMSHVGPFDVEFLGREVGAFDIGPQTSFRRRNFACLKDFISGPSWVLGSATSAAKLKLSIDVDDLNFLWGPIWLLDSSIRTRKGGFIVAVNDAQKGEIECHWTRELLPSRVPISFTPSTRLLIGSNPGLFHTNRDCQTTIASVEDNLAGRLQAAGALNSQIVSDGYSASLGGGKYVTATLGKTWKKHPGTTQKEIILEKCKFESVDILPYLGLNVGLEVSMCTGNASRRTLWDVLCICFAKPNDSGFIFCNHPVGSLDCVAQCCGRKSQASTNTVDNIPRVSSRERVIEAMVLLASTGFGADRKFRLWWPFTEPHSTFELPTKNNKWTRLMKDTPRASTWAVFSDKCLEFEHSLFRKKCKDRDGKTALCVPIISNNLSTGQYISLNEVHLKIEEAWVLGEHQATIASVMGKPMKLILSMTNKSTVHEKRRSDGEQSNVIFLICY